MREATGSSMLLYVVVIVVSVVMLLFVTIISYAKAYGAKNKIISALETYGSYSDEAKAEISENLRQMGYTITRNDYCSSARVTEHLEKLGLSDATNLNVSDGSKYNYCIYNVKKLNNGEYYLVVTFISYNIPVIGNTLLFPVYGETKTIRKVYDY